MKKMEDVIRCMGRFIADVSAKGYHVLSGLMATLLGYFLPIRDIVHLLILFFILDVIFGAWAAKKVRGEKFSVKIIWGHTVPRMILSIILVLGSFMWDTVYSQDMVSTYKMVGWFISGVLLWSIAENGYHITRWSVFPKLGQLFKSKVKDSTGMDVSDEPEKKPDDGPENN